MAEWRNRFDGELGFRAPLGPEQLKSIPARRGVFLLEGPAGEPILLATAANIRARMRFRLAAPDEKPSKRVDLRAVAARLRWKLADSHFETDWQFLELARVIYPARYKELLSFQPAWFVHVDPEDAHPWFRRTRQVHPGSGRHFGPFPDRRSPGRLIEILQDVFGLCRCEQILRSGGSGCVYAQMGRCRAPCEGRISMEEYRRIVAEACRCTEGAREPVRQGLEAEMRRLAAEKLYEEAGECKALLERLEELGREEFRHVGPIERFQYILVQCGPSRQEAKVFLVDRGVIAAAGGLDYPLRPEQAAGTLSAMRDFCAPPRELGPVELERIALVSHYLFVSPQRRGVAARYDGALEAGTLTRLVESAAELLKLRPSRRKASPGRGRHSDGLKSCG